MAFRKRGREDINLGCNDPVVLVDPYYCQLLPLSVLFFTEGRMGPRTSVTVLGVGSQVTGTVVTPGVGVSFLSW